MIDCHFHVWDISKSYYTWLTPELDRIYDTFTIEEYTELAKKNKIEASIVVQAAADIDESLYLLELTKNHPQVQGVIGWVDFESAGVLSDLNVLSKYPKLKGVRPMLQDIEDIDWINDPDFDPIFQFLVENDLIFEALIRQEHLANITHIAKKYPRLKIMINHAAKPIIDGDMKSSRFLEWSDLMQTLSREPNVYCKLSGLITECIDGHELEILEPYMQHLLNSFTNKRLVWGSDWPVLNLRSDYHEWVTMSKKFLSVFSQRTRENIEYKNAEVFYGL